jgi:hypothetical protein
MRHVKHPWSMLFVIIVALLSTWVGFDYGAGTYDEAVTFGWNSHRHAIERAAAKGRVEIIRKAPAEQVELPRKSVLFSSDIEQKDAY